MLQCSCRGPYALLPGQPADAVQRRRCVDAIKEVAQVPELAQDRPPACQDVTLAQRLNFSVCWADDQATALLAQESSGGLHNIVQGRRVRG